MHRRCDGRRKLTDFLCLSDAPEDRDVDEVDYREARQKAAQTSGQLFEGEFGLVFVGHFHDDERVPKVEHEEANDQQLIDRLGQRRPIGEDVFEKDVTVTRQRTGETDSEADGDRCVNAITHNRGRHHGFLSLEHSV